MGVTGLAALAAVGFKAARTVLRTSWFIMMTQRGEAGGNNNSEAS